MIYLSSTDAHTTVVKPQLLQCETGGALDEFLDALHSIRPKRVVAEV